MTNIALNKLNHNRIKHLIQDMLRLLNLGILIILFAALYDIANQITNKEKDKFQFDQLSTRIKAKIIDELNHRGDLLSVEQIKIVHTQKNPDNTIEISYEITFKSNADDIGEIAHQFNATAIFQFTSSDWKISEILPSLQSLTYSKPMIISSTQQKKPKQQK